MPFFDIQFTETFICHSIEAADSDEAQKIARADLEGRYPGYAEVAEVIVKDVTS